MINWALILTNDKQIIESYEIGEIDNAAKQLMDTYKNFVYSTAFRYVKNHFDAEDITQDVFIKAIEKLKYFRKESSIKSWLYRITVNQAKNLLRKKKFFAPFSLFRFGVDENYEIDLPNNENHDKLESSEIEEIFMRAVASLPEKQREIFALRYFEEMDYESISKLLGKSIGGLKANYFHAVRKIANLLENYLEK